MVILASVLFVPRNLAIAILLVYRKLISPLYGDVCRYYPSCSSYGLQQIQQRGLALGAVLTIWRILRCNPWSHGGSDPVTLAPKWMLSEYLRVTQSGFVVARPKRGSN